MTYLDLQFRLQGDSLPVDHGYHLYSAISEVLPELHGDARLGIHNVNGELIGNRRLGLTTRSRLGIRLPLEALPMAISLAGKTLRVAGNRIVVGVPVTRNLTPSARLYSRLVVIKGFLEPQPFLEAAHRQLDELGIHGVASLVESPRDTPWLRRTVNIRGKEIVGFALRVQDLPDEDSLRLQEKGLGGRRRFGCGLFLPQRKDVANGAK